MDRIIIVSGIAIALASCSGAGKLTSLKSGNVAPYLSVADYVSPVELNVGQVRRDTLKVSDADGREMLIMRAVRDENGEMVATERLDAAVVTASFKNVAERHGQVDLRFKVTIPDTMVDSRWQLRLLPELHMLGEIIDLDKVIITGELYRRTQLRGYEQYRRFINGIITDSSLFLKRRNLEVFIQRNIPQLFSLKTDTTYVSDEKFASIYGVTEREAVRHYTDYLRLRYNAWKWKKKDDVFRRLVKVPICSEGLRLDTVVRGNGGEMCYEYVQTVRTRPGLKKAFITLGGGIFDADRKIYDIPRSDSLVFYISSLSTLLDPSEKYRTRIVERCVTDNSVCWIEFSAGRSDVNPSMGYNASEMERINSNLRQLLSNEVFDLDSIVVTASSSPEGTYSFNRRLSWRRSEAVCKYYEKFVKSYRDSVKKEEGIRMSLGDSVEEAGPAEKIEFIPRMVAENWLMLDKLVSEDDSLSLEEKESYLRISQESNPDIRERALSTRPYYRYLREQLYPRLRTVRFDFYLHRKGMVKDTLQTTELDLQYMEALQMVRDRKYAEALKVLRPYRDFNTAVVYSALDYNESALDVLSGLDKTDRTEYLSAIIHSRKGDDQAAVQAYVNACNMNPIYVHRGNLDPEISVLIKRYNINLNKE